jgi:hypothetical protein
MCEVLPSAAPVWLAQEHPTSRTVLELVELLLMLLHLLKLDTKLAVTTASCGGCPGITALPLSAALSAGLLFGGPAGASGLIAGCTC